MTPADADRYSRGQMEDMPSRALLALEAKNARDMRTLVAWMETEQFNPERIEEARERPWEWAEELEQAQLDLWADDFGTTREVAARVAEALDRRDS